jgi:uncharacterized integral membrane protein
VARTLGVTRMAPAPVPATGVTQEGRRNRYRTLQAVVAALLVVGLLTAIFIFQNTTGAMVHFLFWSGSVPLSGALILSAVLGGTLAFLVVFIRQRRIARDLIRSERGSVDLT